MDAHKLSCRVGHCVEDYLLLRKIFLPNALSRKLDRRSQQMRVSLIMQLEPAIGGGAHPVCILPSSIFSETMELGTEGGWGCSRMQQEERVQEKTKLPTVGE